MPHLNDIRIDERLIHGQILQKWLQYTGCKTVIVINDNVADDIVIQSVLSMTLPKDICVEFLNVATGIEKMREVERDDFILLRDLDTLWKLYEQKIPIHNVNVARLPYMAGKRKLYQNVFVSEEEEEILKKLIQHNVNIYVQMVPDNDVVKVENLLE